MQANTATHEAAVAAKVSADASRIIATNSKETLKAAQESTQLEERSLGRRANRNFGSVRGWKEHFGNNTLSNTGKSPALKVNYSMNLQRLPIGQNPLFLFDYQINAWNDETPIAPQGGYQIAMSELGIRGLTENDKEMVGK